MMVAETELRAEEAGSSRDWRRALLTLGVGLAAILLLYSPTVGAMVTIWWRSETFTHGFLVAPISLWLIWRRRARIMAAPPQASGIGAALLACAGFAWLLADLASVNSPSQFALVAMLIGYTWAILGGRAVREMTFPLLFLFFAVPFGEFLLPPMMNMTAEFTIAALKVTGIPVYREGLHFVIPSGSWSVVEACSGVRYLIASLMVGTLYGYLSYHTPRKRALFFLASALVPILANWLRAYMIVMLGHLSGNTLAVGVDHLIYGWVFFGLVMLLMFWIGARWREDDLPPLKPLPTPATATAQSAGRLPAVLALGAALLWMPLGYAIEHVRAVQPVHLAPVAGAGGWVAGGAPLTRWKPHQVGARAMLEQEFVRGGDRVRLTVAYYSHQSQDRELINSLNQLLPTSEKDWILVSSRQTQLAMPPSRVRVAEIKGKGQHLWAWHWYWIDGRTSVSDIEAKLLLAKSKLLLKGDESASVVIVTEGAENAEAAVRILGDFAAAMWPAIDAGIAAAEGATK